jgi:hypothetical protein
MTPNGSTGVRCDTWNGIGRTADSAVVTKPMPTRPRIRSLLGVSHSELCITGDYSGFSVGVQKTRYQYTLIIFSPNSSKRTTRGRGCGYDVTADCLIFVAPLFLIRSRTPTSAGMFLVGEGEVNYAEQSVAYLRLMEHTTQLWYSTR